jgi:hypothetical protein
LFDDLLHFSVDMKITASKNIVHPEPPIASDSIETVDMQERKFRELQLKASKRVKNLSAFFNKDEFREFRFSKKRRHHLVQSNCFMPKETQRRCALCYCRPTTFCNACLVPLCARPCFTQWHTTATLSKRQRID